MKKNKFLTLMIFFILIRPNFYCNKDNSSSNTATSQCYNCKYGTINGYTRPPDVQCTNDINSYKPIDSQGNDITRTCIPK